MVLTVSDVEVLTKSTFEWALGGIATCTVPSGKVSAIYLSGWTLVRTNSTRCSWMVRQRSVSVCSAECVPRKRCKQSLHRDSQTSHHYCITWAKEDTVLSKRHRKLLASSSIPAWLSLLLPRAGLALAYKDSWRHHSHVYSATTLWRAIHHFIASAVLGI